MATADLTILALGRAGALGPRSLDDAAERGDERGAAVGEHVLALMAAAAAEVVGLVAAAVVSAADREDVLAAALASRPQRAQLGAAAGLGAEGARARGGRSRERHRPRLSSCRRTPLPTAQHDDEDCCGDARKRRDGEEAVHLVSRRRAAARRSGPCRRASARACRAARRA
jgi:hypothetical protein